nr:site-specific integrase [Streptomyces sp. NBC_00974]WSX54307.1 site-specific integrase [Streptomyces sp. NBC_00974]
MSRPGPVLPLFLDHPARSTSDRLELLTALVNGPRFDPLFRGELLVVPPDHPVYRWRCRVSECERPGQHHVELCFQHDREWAKARDAGGNQAEFLDAATPLKAARWAGQVPCRVCPDCPATSKDRQLCRRHASRWHNHGRPDKPPVDFESWVLEQSPLDGYGSCPVASCRDLAASPLKLCRWHELFYRREGCPGGAALPEKWARYYEVYGKPVPVTYADRRQFEQWCRTARSETLHGQVNLRGLRPLVKAEIQWGLFKHTEGDRTRWPLPWVQALVNFCRDRDLGSVVDIDVDQCTHLTQMIARETLNELRLIYFTPETTREAGFIETDHFGIRFPGRISHYDLTGVSQRWLRDVLWDYLAAILRSPKCPRTGATFDHARRSIVFLSAFLEADAREGGHDPALLQAKHMDRFVADLRHRERNGLESLGIHRSDGKPSVVTESSRVLALGAVRRILRTALESGECERIGLTREFIVATPAGGNYRGVGRRPFPDHVAQALADDGNLRQLDEEFDTHDGGLRDIWETLIATGRRASEVIKLKLECTARHNRIPMLWHDQTKVGNYDQAIRIPERVFERLAERRTKTIARFTQRHGRPPTATERENLALFPTRVRNPHGTKPLSYSHFQTQFRAWVDQLDLGHYVSHQARHTLATSLLKHGAGLHHIKRYLGQVSQRMAEHYAKVASSEIDDVLQHVWVTGPGAPNPGELISGTNEPMSRAQAQALAVDLSRSSTPAEGGLCTFQPVVNGDACPWNLDCHNCKEFVLSGADLLYWRRKREQWMSIAERSPDDATADYLHKVFEPTGQAIDGLEKALAGLGLLDDALALDLRRPQDYFHRLWSTAFRASDLAQTSTEAQDEYNDEGIPT